MGESVEIFTLRRVNECISGLGHCGGGEPLFDGFWRAGELALMLGPAGAGKSVLAVQIADALARGRGMEGFEMPAGRRKVLYVDLAFSDRQFGERYSYYSPNARLAKSYKFARNLYRGRPAAAEDLCEWLEAAVRDNGFDAVIVDDLSAVKRTHDGIRETLAAMRRLKKLCDESGVAILAITGCDAPLTGRMVRMGDMGRSRVLCGVADSVIALGPGAGDVGEQCLVQLRVRNGTIFWKEGRAPAGRVERLENGLLGFRFDKRFHPYIDKATLELINRIRAMRQRSKTFKAIAAELGISKTRAFDLNNKWIPSMDEREDEEFDDDDLDEYDEHDEFAEEDGQGNADSPPGLRRGGESRSLRFDGVVMNACPDPTSDLPHSPVTTPSAGQKSPVCHPSLDKEGSSHVAFEAPRRRQGPERVSVYDLKRGINRVGEEIFIESTDENSGRPKIWYQFDPRGNKYKFVQGNLGRTSYNLGPTEYL